jgi:hypothetical protein
MVGSFLCDGDIVETKRLEQRNDVVSMHPEVPVLHPTAEIAIGVCLEVTALIVAQGRSGERPGLDFSSKGQTPLIALGHRRIVEIVRPYEQGVASLRQAAEEFTWVCHVI